MIVSIIQARMNSSRLPGKIMLTVCEKPLLLHQIERMKDSKTIDKIVIATSVKKEDDIIKKFCEIRKINIKCFEIKSLDLSSFLFDEIICLLETQALPLTLSSFISANF